MEVIELKTLIDITETRVVRINQGTQLELDQNRNFITLKQCIELRSIVHYDAGPYVENLDLKSLRFGTAYKGKQNVWTFIFTPDRETVYQDSLGNPIGFLVEDLHEIPVIKNLTETINIIKPIFNTKDEEYRNIVIRSIPSLYSD